MPKYPVLTAEQIIKILKLLGFYEIRQKGSHKQLRDGYGKSTTIPMHKGKDVSPVLLKQILKDIDVDLDTFKKYL